jgi:hypothetical protein
MAETMGTYFVTLGGTISRRAEPDDLEAQIGAVKQLQGLPAFKVREPMSESSAGHRDTGADPPVMGERGLLHGIGTLERTWRRIVGRLFGKSRSTGQSFET